MAINIKPNQALGFNQDLPCQCGGDYCQPVLDTDTIMLQGTVTETTGECLINYDGWQLDSYGTPIPLNAWHKSGGLIYCIGAPDDTYKAKSNTLGMVAGEKYLVHMKA